MLYINENEKKHIKSLYYTKDVNEQVELLNPMKAPTLIKGSLFDTYNKVITRYSGEEKIHNILDDTELAAAFATAGVGDVYIGTLHSLYWFYEGFVDQLQESRIKKFILGIVELVLAIPGLSELKFLDRWKDFIKKSPITQTIEKLSKSMSPFWSKIRTYFLQAIASLRKLDDFLVKQQFEFLSRVCKKIINSINNIKLWFDDMIIYFQKLCGSFSKHIESSIKPYANQTKDNNVVDIIDKTIEYGTPIKGVAKNTNNMQMSTQDTTNPIYYKPKVNPNQPNVKYTN
jgi:hypothetical protein